MGEYGIVSTDFANKNFKNMAGYRNRIVHFYADITPQEIHTIIHQNPSDFDVFLAGIKNVLNEPSRYGIAEK